MKKIILFVAIATLAMQSYAQVIEVKQVPNVVVTTFQGAYPTVSNPQWVKVDGNYEVMYTNDNNDMFVTYTPTGQVIEQAESVTVYPEAATTYVKTKYKSDGMKKVYKIKDSNGKTIYKAKVKGDKGETYLLFDSNGNYIGERKF